MIKQNEFPTKTERERISTLRKYQKLYDNEQMSVLSIHEIIKRQYSELADLVYLAHAIPFRITEFYGDFVQGEVDSLIIQSPFDQEADQKWIETVVYENDLKEKISDLAEEQSEFGFTVLLGYVENDVYKITSVPADQYFPQSDGSVIFVTYKKDPEDKLGTSKRLLMHTQHYQLQNGKVIIEHEAFKTDDKGVAHEKYNLQKMAKLIGKEKLPEKETLDIDELPIRQVDNGRRSKYGFGKSDYANIMPQLAEINERTTHTSTQLLKNLDAKMAVPSSAYDEDGKLKHAEAYTVDTKQDFVPQYIINANPLIAEAREHVMGELKFVEWVTGVPMWALTKGSQPERVETLRIQLFTALRKTSKKRAKIKRGLLDLVRIGAKLTGQSEQLQGDDITIQMSDPLPEDDEKTVNVESEKVRSGLSSKKSAMKRIENFDDEQAEAEMEQINSETQVAGIGDRNNAPTI